jgi:hypothetical protein
MTKKRIETNCSVHYQEIINKSYILDKPDVDHELLCDSCLITGSYQMINTSFLSVHLGTGY